MTEPRKPSNVIAAIAGFLGMLAAGTLYVRTRDKPSLPPTAPPTTSTIAPEAPKPITPPDPQPVIQEPVEPPITRPKPTVDPVLPAPKPRIGKSGYTTVQLLTYACWDLSNHGPAIDKLQAHATTNPRSTPPAVIEALAVIEHKRPFLVLLTRDLHCSPEQLTNYPLETAEDLYESLELVIQASKKIG